MKKVLLTGVAFAALACGPVLAADMPVRRGMPVKGPQPVPVIAGYSWSGFYIGGHVGGGWGDKCFAELGVGSDGCHEADGWLGGGQVGYNWQTGNIVFGVEFSGSLADISGSHTSLLAAPDQYNSEVSSVFLLTGRVGYAFDRLLLYATGGGAWVRHKFEYTTPGFATDSAKQTRGGWTIGGGLEYAFSPNWSLAAQYNFIDLGDKDVAFPLAGFAATTESELHLATVRLNYRFGGGGVGPLVGRY
jgi:outer membrane immunogenic protein